MRFLKNILGEREPYNPEPDVINRHVALLGDSILDNGAYTKDDPDVTTCLAGILGDQWAVTLAAVDGAVAENLHEQIQTLPPGVTELVVSVGGNNALRNSGILYDKDQGDMRDHLEELSLIQWEFQWEYDAAMWAVCDLGLPVTVCTIYDCDFDNTVKDATRAAMSVFNDVIIRFALSNDLPILDLRTVCTMPDDYEMAIEPSGLGGLKIAHAIARHVTGGATLDRRERILA